MGFPTADAIQAGTSIGGSIIQAIAQKKAQERQNAANRELAEYSYSKDLEMWNRQNAYNNPQAQMERFSEAGLNPHLIYGKGNPGNATTLPKYQTPTASIKSFVPNAGDELGKFQNLQLQKAQIDIATNQARLLDEKVTTESVNRAYMAERRRDMYNKNQYWWSPNDYFGYKNESRYSTYRDIIGNTAQKRDEGARHANTLARYNWQIAEQNLMLKQKDNMYYMWKNLYGPLGGSIIKGAGNMFKFFKGSARVAGSRLKTPNFSKGGLGPRGYKGKGSISVNDWYGYQRKFSGW